MVFQVARVAASGTAAPDGVSSGWAPQWLRRSGTTVTSPVGAYRPGTGDLSACRSATTSWTDTRVVSATSWIVLMAVRSLSGSVIMDPLAAWSLMAVRRWPMTLCASRARSRRSATVACAASQQRACWRCSRASRREAAWR